MAATAAMSSCPCGSRSFIFESACPHGAGSFDKKLHMRGLPAAPGTYWTLL
jgi:hypothetical protein